MIFAVDGEKINVTPREVSDFGLSNNDRKYKMVMTKQVDEAEMFRVFKKNKNIVESKWKIEHADEIRFDDEADDIEELNQKFVSALLGKHSMPNPNTFSQQVASSGHNRYVAKSFGSIQQSAPVQFKQMFPFTGAYIIPKMFGYFPFLDCDDINTYTEAKFQLSADNIPYTAYQSSKYDDHYWIFCDKQTDIHSAIDFIESYPCDHRYPWIARHKEELCIRAIPKKGYQPRFDEEHLKEEFTDDFAYWNTQFVKYWESGLIPSYIDMVNTVDAI